MGCSQADKCDATGDCRQASATLQVLAGRQAGRCEVRDSRMAAGCDGAVPAAVSELEASKLQSGELAALRDEMALRRTSTVCCEHNMAS